MAFLDKLGDLTKNVADKTNTMLEVSRLNSQIAEEKNKIVLIKGKISEYYFARYQSGEALDPEAMEYCAQISNSENAIHTLNQEIQNIKTQPAMPRPSTENRFCPACGTAVEIGMRFCSSCGGKME